MQSKLCSYMVTGDGSEKSIKKKNENENKKSKSIGKETKEQDYTQKIISS